MTGWPGFARNRPSEIPVKGASCDQPARKAIPPVPERRSLKPGTDLMREHAGTMHRVIVVTDGFSWNGASYRSLSEVARTITGTNWNGSRFFGLRDKAKPARPRPWSSFRPLYPEIAPHVDESTW
jgi:hypothetical protein